MLKLLVDLGEMCSVYQDHKLRGIRAERIQCDEIWSFVGAKQKNVWAGETGDGDVWTWTAMDADSKLMVCWLVGPRTGEAAREFMKDLAGRLATRVRLTTDGLTWYLSAVEEAFGRNGTDYAQLVKVYASQAEGPARYSPPVCTAAVKQWVMGNPDKDEVSTSYVERQSLTMRMGMRRFTRLTNAFSKKLEDHAHAVALHFLHYNFARPPSTLTKAYPRHYPTTPAMAAGLTDHVWTVEEICALLDTSRLLQ